MSGETPSKTFPLPPPVPLAPPADGYSKTRELLKKHGGAERIETRGRHPLDCRCGACVGSRRAASNEVARTSGLEPGPVVSAPLDRGIIQKSLGKLAGTVDRYFTRRVFRVATKVSGGDKNFAQELALEAGLKEDERDLISDLGADVCLQYGVHGQHAAAVALSICLVDYGSRMSEALNKLAAMEQRMSAGTPKPKEENGPAKTQP